jgi:ketosteroid isomerase-like protein
MYAGFAGLAGGGDVGEYVRRFYDPGCEYYPLEESGPVRGHDELIRWNGDWFEVWDELDVELVDLVPAGEKVVTEVKVEGRGNKSGLEVSQAFFHAFELRNGRIFRMYEYETREEALKQL